MAIVSRFRFGIPVCILGRETRYPQVEQGRIGFHRVHEESQQQHIESYNPR